MKNLKTNPNEKFITNKNTKNGKQSAKNSNKHQKICNASSEYEKIQQIKKNKETTTSADSFVYTNIDDMLLIKSLMEIHHKYLINFQTSIDTFKKNCNEFTKENDFSRSYKEKKNLTVKYMKCLDSKEKEIWRK